MDFIPRTGMRMMDTMATSLLVVMDFVLSRTFIRRKTRLL
jgi:hypothetical protein